MRKDKHVTKYYTCISDIKVSLVKERYLLLLFYKMLVALFVVAIVLAVVYFKRKYFTLVDPIPGLSPHLLFGNSIQSGLLFGKPLPIVLAEFKDRYGDIFQFWFGPSRVIVVGGIRDVKHIFTHRHIYEQGRFVVEGVGNFVPDSLATVTG